MYLTLRSNFINIISIYIFSLAIPLRIWLRIPSNTWIQTRTNSFGDKNNPCLRRCAVHRSYEKSCSWDLEKKCDELPIKPISASYWPITAVRDMFSVDLGVLNIGKVGGTVSGWGMPILGDRLPQKHLIGTYRGLSGYLWPIRAENADWFRGRANIGPNACVAWARVFSRL